VCNGPTGALPWTLASSNREWGTASSRSASESGDLSRNRGVTPPGVYPWRVWSGDEECLERLVRIG